MEPPTHASSWWQARWACSPLTSADGTPNTQNSR